ncbi:biotin/lipoyl-binding protein, partial [Bartonella rattaustraliani]
MSTTETIVSTKKYFNKKRMINILLIILALCVILFSYRWLTYWRYMISTDDAYVQGDIAAIAPKLTGYIEKVPVKANQIVKKGD